MRDPKFVSINPNYRKRVLAVTLSEGRHKKQYELPFAALPGCRISTRNPFTLLEIDKSIGCQAVRFALNDGSSGDFPADLVLFYCDPNYDWSPINQVKNALKRRIAEAGLSIRVLARTLHTSPSQIVRLLEEDRAVRQLEQLCRLAEAAGCRLDIKLETEALRQVS